MVKSYSLYTPWLLSLLSFPIFIKKKQCCFLHNGQARKDRCETSQHHHGRLPTDTRSICLGELLLHAPRLARLHREAARRAAVVAGRAASGHGAGASAAEEPAVCAGRRCGAAPRGRGRIGREDHDGRAVRDDGCRRDRAVVHVAVPAGAAAASAVGGEAAVEARRTARLGVVAPPRG